MPNSVQCVKANVVANGRVYIEWSDNRQSEFASVADMHAALADVVNETESTEQMKKLIMARAMIPGNSNGHNLAAIEGKTITYNRVAANNVMRVV